jgi:hypothetical protein
MSLLYIINLFYLLVLKRNWDETFTDSSLYEVLKPVTGNLELHTMRTCFHVKTILGSVKEEEVSIFIREEIIRFNDILNTKKFIIVSGSLGIGKTISSWIWICDYSFQVTTDPSEKLLWIDTVTKKTTLIQNRKFIVLTEDLHNFVVDNISVIIYEGVTNDLNWKDLWVEACKYRQLNYKVLIVTSAQVKVKSHLLGIQGGVEFDFEPWDIDEYFKVCKEIK